MPRRDHAARLEKPRSRPWAVAVAQSLPRILVNAKAYAQTVGPEIRRLAEACDTLHGDGVPVALAPPLAELASLARRRGARAPLFAQHVDVQEPGAATGWVTVEAVAAAGAVGSLLNHAEHKVPHAQVKATVVRLHAARLGSVLCADSLAEARALAAFKPTMLAIEPPELIGGDLSVTTADPAIVSNAVQAVRKVSPKTNVLCGAGVKNGDDVAMALELGAYGVLLASGVVKAKSPLRALRNLARGL